MDDDGLTAALTRLTDDSRRAWRALDAGASAEEVAAIMGGEVDEPER
ncbi:hypothetical protein AB0J28_00765 [Streptosporangium canum]|jgi:hypothetical protein